MIEAIVRRDYREISFIGRANSLSDVGQCAAASAPASDRAATPLIDTD